MSDSTTPGSGLALLPTEGDSARWTEKQKAIMGALGLMGEKKRRMIQGEWQDVFTDAAPSGVVEMFLSQARRLGLDPMAKQIYCIERGGKWGIQASIDGFRLVAERSGKYKGQTAPQWCGQDGVWREVWLDDGAPAAARIGVRREDFDDILWAVATYNGYCPRDKDGVLKPTNQWKTNPANQLLKCAEMLALRKAFPQDLSGIYGQEEMDQAEPVDITATATVSSGGDLHSVHADGVDEHKIIEHSEGAVKAWTEWKEAIDAAPDKKALGALYSQAKELLNKPIPVAEADLPEGLPAGALVGDYFMLVAAILPDSSETVEAHESQPEQTDETTGEIKGGEPPQVEPEPAAPATEVTEWATATIPDADPTQPATAADDDTPF
jgi:phage recombination protein Bet